MEALTHSLIIPVMNQLHDVKGILKLLRDMTSENTEFIFIDNGSTDDYENYIYKYLKPRKVQYIRNEKNVGMLQTMQQGYEAADGDIISYLHNDVYIYEKNWDIKLIQKFYENPNLGVVGAFGASGVGPDGGRIQVVQPGKAPGFSNMLEADIHGERTENWKFISIIDGFLMSIRRDLLVKTNGFDVNTYKWHHFYDRDICLESLRHGYKNMVMPLSCHHVCGRTANQSEYQDFIREKYPQGTNENTKQYQGDKATHDDNMAAFGKKWGEVLPLYVDQNSGDLWIQQPYKNTIVGYSL